MPNLEQLFQRLWEDYCKLSPQALRIQQEIQARGEAIVNDHIALRTFKVPKIGLERVARPFEQLGYKAMGEYTFTEKKLYARHWEHPNPNHPKIFISELEIEKLPSKVQSTIEKLVEPLDESKTNDPFFFVGGRPWKMDYKTYQELADVSEYAGWVAAFGFRPNHFTISVNHLKTFGSLEDLNNFLKSKGHKLNTSGGEIKGTPAELLEQSSTLAESIEVEFADGRFRIPSVYYEFARRYPMPNGKLYSGFISKSADKIFESTNRQL